MNPSTIEEHLAQDIWEGDSPVLFIWNLQITGGFAHRDAAMGQKSQPAAAVGSQGCGWLWEDRDGSGGIPVSLQDVDGSRGIWMAQGGCGLLWGPVRMGLARQS